MIDQESLKSIENLHRMKAEGIITEAEFEQSKQRILFGSKPSTVRAPGPVPTVDRETGTFMDWAVLPYKRYADFQGRSGRREFWSFLVVTTIIPLVVGILGLQQTDIRGDTTAAGSLMLLLVAVFTLASIIPLLAVQARRFHDQDRSGWLTLLNLIPYAGSLVVLVFMFFEGSGGPNQYGPDPMAS